MKKIVYLFVALPFIFISPYVFSQKLVENELDVMKGIRQNTQADFYRDDFNIIAIISIVISLVSFIFSVATYKEQKGTKNNTKKISQDTQRNLMNDLVRHLYRNYVITYALRTKLDEINFNGYPSEEHLCKLKIPMENIHLEAFFGCEKNYELMHDLYLKLRNYNEEVSVTLNHLKDKQVDINTKVRDLDTLEFKVSFLTERIVETEYEIWGNQIKVKEGILHCLDIGINNVTSAKSNIYNEGCDDFRRISIESVNNTYYAKLLGHNELLIELFTEKLNEAIEAERMLNERGAEKIHIIKFNS